MSVVTNIILVSTPSTLDCVIDRVNEFFKADGQKPLVSIDDESLPVGWYGGSKMFEADCYIGAINYLNLSEFVKHLRNMDWDAPCVHQYRTVQLFVSEEDDNEFRVIWICRDGRVWG